MAEKYDMDTDTVHRVTYALQDLSLFTEKEGSMPPYSYRLQIEQASIFPKILESPIPGQTEDDQNEPDNPPDTEERTGNPPMEEAEDPLPDASTRMRTDVEHLKVQFGGLNTRKDGFETQLSDVSTKINQLVDQRGQAGTPDPATSTIAIDRGRDFYLAGASPPYARACVAKA